MTSFIDRLVAGFDDADQIAGYLVMLAVCLYALARGGRTERLAGGVLAVAFIASGFTQDITDLIGPQLGVFAVDVLLLAALLAMAVRSNRAWVLFAAGFHLLGVLAHLAIALDPSLRAAAYAVVLNLLAYMVFVSLAVGTWDADRRRRIALTV